MMMMMILSLIHGDLHAKNDSPSLYAAYLSLSSTCTFSLLFSSHWP
jgi:hypothetical protein